MAGESRFGFPITASGSATNMPFYLFGEGGRSVVRCRTRWVADNRVYVVAPLGTARAVKQRWEASAWAPSDSGGPSGQRPVPVELVSAESLLGSDSGMEGLLLRIARPEHQAPLPFMPAAVKESQMAPASFGD
jgi:hypothetical protein